MIELVSDGFVRIDGIVEAGSGREAGGDVHLAGHRDGVLINGLVASGDGFSGAPASAIEEGLIGARAVGEPGGRGGSVHVTGTRLFFGDEGRIIVGNGGPGGEALAMVSPSMVPGLSATAIGGLGGASGVVTLPAGEVALYLINAGRIIGGIAGEGGNALACVGRFATHKCGPDGISDMDEDDESSRVAPAGDDYNWQAANPESARNGGNGSSGHSAEAKGGDGGDGLIRGGRGGSAFALAGVGGTGGIGTRACLCGEGFWEQVNPGHGGSAGDGGSAGAEGGKGGTALLDGGHGGNATAFAGVAGLIGIGGHGDHLPRVGNFECPSYESKDIAYCYRSSNAVYICKLPTWGGQEGLAGAVMSEGGIGGFGARVQGQDGLEASGVTGNPTVKNWDWDKPYNYVQEAGKPGYGYLYGSCH